MLRIGIAGLGFMGKMHFKCYNALDNAKVVAICDIDERKFTAADGTAGNIAGTQQPLELNGNAKEFWFSRNLYAQGLYRKSP